MFLHLSTNFAKHFKKNVSPFTPKGDTKNSPVSKFCAYRYRDKIKKTSLEVPLLKSCYSCILATCSYYFKQQTICLSNKNALKRILMR